MIYHYAEWSYAKCRVLFMFMLIAIILSVIMLNVIMLNVVALKIVVNIVHRTKRQTRG
jgi:hypothetical protein